MWNGSSLVGRLWLFIRTSSNSVELHESSVPIDSHRHHPISPLSFSSFQPFLPHFPSAALPAGGGRGKWPGGQCSVTARPVRPGLGHWGVTKTGIVRAPGCRAPRPVNHVTSNGARHQHDDLLLGESIHQIAACIMHHVHTLTWACRQIGMWACMHVCMYVCMYVCMHVCMYVCVGVCVCTCMYMYVYECMYTCIFLYTFMYVHRPYVFNCVYENIHVSNVCPLITYIYYCITLYYFSY